MAFFKSEDIFREYEKVDPTMIPQFSVQERFSLIIAALSIVMPYFLGIMGGVWVIILILKFIL